LNALLARLGRYGSGQTQEAREVDLAALAEALCGRFKGVHPVTIASKQRAIVLADPEGLEQALIHLVQNAVDASEPDAAVMLTTSTDGLAGQIEIIDAGTGMSPEFVRTQLFKPFVSSKQGGFGIGAFEAREMIKAMGGRLMVESRKGVGTRFNVSLPVPEAGRILQNRKSPQTHSNTKEVA